MDFRVLMGNTTEIEHKAIQINKRNKPGINELDTLNINLIKAIEN